MSNQTTIKFFCVSSCLAAAVFCSACDPGQSDEAKADTFTQVKQASPMDDYASTRSPGDVAYFLGSWELPPWENCALVHVYRSPDYPVDVWVDWLNEDLEVVASRPTDLDYNFFDSFEIDFSQTGDSSGTFSLVANITIDPSKPPLPETPVWAHIEPCR